MGIPTSGLGCCQLPSNHALVHPLPVRERASLMVNETGTSLFSGGLMTICGIRQGGKTQTSNEQIQI